jgi:hypothetical protein
MGELRRFTVKVYYREPTYELRVGPKADPYSMQYEIPAHDQDEAIRRATAALNESLPESSVGWIRDVVGVTVDGVAAAIPIPRATIPAVLPLSIISRTAPASKSSQKRRRTDIVSASREMPTEPGRAQALPVSPEGAQQEWTSPREIPTERDRAHEAPLVSPAVGLAIVFGLMFLMSRSCH